MPYQSPLHILDSLQISPDDLNSEGIGRLRKKLLAEFSLNTNITIKVKDTDYTKDAILKVIDQLKETDNLALHKEIFSRKPLLNWLENPNNEAFPEELGQEILNAFTHTDLSQNIFQEAFIEDIRFNFRKRNFDKVKESLIVLVCLRKEYVFKLYDLVNDEIQAIISDINKAKKRPNIKENRALFGFIIDSKWTKFLNILPDYFEEIRDNYCLSAVNYTVSVQQLNRDWTHKISLQLCQTICNDSLKNDITANHNIYTHNLSKDKTSSGLSRWSIFWIIIVILSGLSRLNSNKKPVAITQEKPSQSQKSLEKILKNPKIKNYGIDFLFYQTKLVNGDFEGGKKINITTGQDPMPNLNLGYANENTNGKNTQTVVIQNNTDFDLVLFNIGRIHRSYFIKSKESYSVKSFYEDNLFFYFGKEWRQIYPRAKARDKDIENKRFQGYFSQPHKNTNKVLKRFYTIRTTGNTLLTLDFNNETLED